MGPSPVPRSAPGSSSCAAVIVNPSVPGAVGGKGVMLATGQSKDRPGDQDPMAECATGDREWGVGGQHRSEPEEGRVYRKEKAKMNTTNALQIA